MRAAGQIYQQHGRSSWLNPDGEKNKSWSGRYIDVIVPSNAEQNSAWVIEVETDHDEVGAGARDAVCEEVVVEGTRTRHRKGRHVDRPCARLVGVDRLLDPVGNRPPVRVADDR